MLSNWWRRWLRSEENRSRRAKRLANRRPRTFRPSVELLEDRLAPALFTVNALTDFGTGSGTTGDLRYCINQVNTNGQDNTIQFVVDGTIELGSELELSAANHAITIDGNGNGVILDGQGATRIFLVDAGVTAKLNGLVIAGGYDNYAGGGIYNSGALTVSDCLLSDDTSFEGGGIYNEGALTVSHSQLNGDSGYHGGAIYNDASSTSFPVSAMVVDSVISGCYATTGGGVSNVEARLTVADSDFNYDSASFAGGGGIENVDGTVIVSASNFSDDSAGSGSVGGSGGGILNSGTSTLTVWSSSFTYNTATQDGGGIASSGTLTVSYSTFAYNQAGSSGGGIDGVATVV